jgi:serine/threonine-protein kinase
MGEVYRARDTKLGRDVALKILPDSFAADPERLARFQREAQVLASLNHPHIGAIYGLEELDGVRALVLELVDGPTLADRIAQGPVPLDEALTIARQIAEAVEAAHEQGIIHRDLKPANIKLRRDGAVKVLDFGLAKALAPAGSETVAVTAMATRDGVIVGTPAYMSPEQARGDAAGRQTDIWSFGVVLYELLTGASPFGRRTMAETLACVIGSQPDYSVLPSGTPSTARRLVRRCLEKDQKRRLQHMGDVRLEVEDALAARTSGTAPVSMDIVAARERPWQVAGAIVLVAIAGTGGWLVAHRSTSQAPAAVVRLSIPSLEPPFRGPFGTRHLAISDDGSRVAYISASRIWIRRIGQAQAVTLAADASSPFFSPNGEWVGFFSQGNVTGLMKVSALGGAPVRLVATADRPGGGTWRADGTIVFATSAGLFQVSENGGEPRLLMKPDPRRNERRYMWPQFMPGGRSVLFTIIPEDSTAGAQIGLLDLQTLATRIVSKEGSAAQYASTGHLVYASGRTLKAIAFDADLQQTRGDPVSLPDIEVATAPDNGAAEFALSSAGTLLFIAPDMSGGLRTLSWVDRQGKEEPLGLAPGRYQYPRVSPDGTRVALDISSANRDIWIWNRQRQSLTKLTNGPTEDMTPVWSPDGQRVFFASDRTGNFDVYSQAADGATDARVEYTGPGFQTPVSFTPDGARLIVFEDFRNLGVLTLGRPDRLEPLLRGAFETRLGMMSPDGNWIAYESNESGNQIEIFVRPFPNVNGRREKVSIDGGRYPLWGPRSSGELFYVDLKGGVMAASVTLSPGLTLGRVRKLFDWEKPPVGVSARPYDISPVDGRFLITRPATTGSDGAINISVVLNWFEELKQHVPTSR